MEKIIVLVGLMGAGKSTIGRRLAKILNVEFKDSDDEIVEAAGCSISDIFYIHGEQIFRDLEKRVLTRLLTDGVPKILATGGGAWMNEDVRALTHQHAHSVWLQADIEVLLDRVNRKNTRPLLAQGDKRSILLKMLEERSPVYALAEYHIDSGKGSHEDIIKGIMRALQLKEEMYHAIEEEIEP